MNVPHIYPYLIIFICLFVGIRQALSLTDPHEFNNMLVVHALTPLAS